jgi:hypothetical protein
MYVFNSAESISEAFTSKAGSVPVGSNTFVAICLVNVPESWKDVRFV